jgi:hypothetical protein
LREGKGEEQSWEKDVFQFHDILRYLRCGGRPAKGGTQLDS